MSRCPNCNGVGITNHPVRGWACVTCDHPSDPPDFHAPRQEPREVLVPRSLLAEARDVIEHEWGSVAEGSDHPVSHLAARLGAYLKENDK